MFIDSRFLMKEKQIKENEEKESKQEYNKTWVNM